MTTREFLENRQKAEYPTFMKVMKAMPTDRFDYRPFGAWQNRSRCTFQNDPGRV